MTAKKPTRNAGQPATSYQLLASSYHLKKETKMFKLSTSETYTAPVTVELPGEKTKRTFEVEFKRLTKPQIQDLYTRASEADKDVDENFCREVVVGWNGIKDEAGDTVEFSHSSFEQLLAIYPVPAAIVTAFNVSISGARLKN
jgi:Phage tail assembly chaperone